MTGMEGVIASWTMVYPFLIVSGYAIELICLKPAMAVARSISGFDPSAVPQAPGPEA